MNKLTNEQDEKTLKMNLQYFAAATDPADDPADPPADPAGGKADDPADPGITLPASQSELDAHTNKVVQKALDNQQKALDAKLEAEREEAISEGKRLANLTEDQQRVEEEKIRQEKLDKREAELNRREMVATTSELIRAEGLPQSFVELVVADEAETVQENIKNVKDAFDKAVEEEVDKRLVQKQTKTGTSTGGLTKRDIMKVKDKSERERLISENMGLFTN